jgi:3'-phosphoadenosine 5'-phosphosulfate sulfotransferase (PAPS reductase)/FAD synthetase
MMIINHGGMSGGKDSTALFLWMVHESGYPQDSLLFSFCDTGNESPLTYEFIRMLSEKIHPIVTIHPEKDFYDLARHKGRFPSAKARFCTEDLKMKPTRMFVQALQEHKGAVLIHSGVRAAESQDRAKLPEREMSLYFGMEIFRPLLKWTIDDVWSIHKRYGIEPNPLYAAGCQRVGCLPCIMSRKSEIANIANKWPERIDIIREAEGSIKKRSGQSSLFASDKVPLRYRNVVIQTTDRPAKDTPEPQGQEVMDLSVDKRSRIPSREMRIATIDAVVEWSRNNPDLYTEEFDFFEDLPACDSRYGACE